MSQHYSDNDERMSDTDSEVIPSSQPDSSMVYTESQVALMKRAKGDAEMQPEQSQASQFSASGSQRNPMEDQLSCGICLSVMDNPFLVLPCMHSYCRECLDHWWQNQANCPICKQRSQLAKHNFHLANIIDQFRRDANRVSRRQLDDSAREDLYPRGRRPHMLAPMSLPSTQSQSQSQGPLLFDAVLMIPSFGSVGMGTQSQSQANVPQPLPDTLPGGNLKTIPDTAAQSPSTLRQRIRFRQNNKPTDLEEPLLDLLGEAKIESGCKRQSLISFLEPPLITNVLAAPPIFLLAGTLNGRN
ncbi:hypothetical protein FRC00_013001, partial [Tulasnella sp. 408]